MIEIICQACMLRWKFDGVLTDRPSCPSCGRRQTNGELLADVGQYEQVIADSGPDLPAIDEQGKRFVVLTFDDGAVSHVKCVAPALAERGMRGIFSVVTSRPFGPSTERGLEAAATLHAVGHAIVSHTHTHPDLSLLTPRDVLAELRLSTSLLREYGCYTPGFTYPYNRGIGLVHEALKAVGIDWALANTNYFEGACVGYHPRYLLPRAPAHCAKAKCINCWDVGKIPVLTFHSVGERQRHDDVPEAVFASFLDWLASQGATTTTNVTQFCRTH